LPALRTRLRIIAIIAFTSAAAAGGIVGYLASRGSPDDHASATATSSPLPASAVALARCATAPRAVLSAASLPGFEAVVSGLAGRPLVHTLPLDIAPASDQPADYTDFVLGRAVGLVSPEAYLPQFLRQSQAYQKKMHYKVTDTPELPLQGQIVTDNPAGILEAYQLNTVYSSPVGAESFQHLETSNLYSRGKIPGVTVITLPGALAADPAYMVDNGSGQETGYYVNLIVDGLVQVDFNFRGGPRVPLAAISRLATLGLGDLTSACDLR
jgi:hypothetical protein